MSDIPTAPSSPGSFRKSALWIVAILVILGSIAAWFVVRQRAAQTALIDSQFERLQRLGTAVVEYAKAHEGELPDDPKAVLTGVDVSESLTDLATGQPLTYRIVTLAGERIRYDFVADRVIAWSPQSSYRGCRAVLLNSGEARFAPDSALKLDEQRLLVTDVLSQTRPRLSTAEPAEGDDEPAPPDDAATQLVDQPATAPTTLPRN
jgi:hypothetical protein